MRTNYSQLVFECLDKRIAKPLRGNLDVILRFIMGGVAVAPGIVVVTAHVAVAVLRVDIRPGRYHTFTDRTSHGIGVEIWDDDVGGMINSIVLPENSVVPAEGHQDYVTTDDYQQAIKLTVRQGETSEIKYTTVIGETELKLRPKPKGSPIRVVISCDTDSIIHVHVIDLTDNEDLGEMRINRVANLTDEEVQRAQNRLGKLNIGWED